MSLPIPARVINGLLRPKSPAGKLRRIFFEQDLYALLRKDRIKATKAIGLHRTFYVDPQALSRSLRWGGRGHNIISFSLDQVTA